MTLVNTYNLLTPGTGRAMGMFYVIMAYFLRSMPMCYGLKVFLWWVEGEKVYESQEKGIFYFEVELGLATGEFRIFQDGSSAVSFAGVETFLFLTLLRILSREFIDEQDIISYKTELLHSHEQKKLKEIHLKIKVFLRESKESKCQS